MPGRREDGDAPRVEFVVNRSPLLPVPCQTRHTWEDPDVETTTCRVCGALRAVLLWDPWSADEDAGPVETTEAPDPRAEDLRSKV